MKNHDIEAWNCGLRCRTDVIGDCGGDLRCKNNEIEAWDGGLGISSDVLGAWDVDLRGNGMVV